MPYSIVESVKDKEKVRRFYVYNHHSGKLMSGKPLTYQTALRQLQALHIHSKE